MSRETKAVFFFLVFFFVCLKVSLVFGHQQQLLLSFVAVNVFQGFELLNQGLVLVFQNCHAVFQTLDVLLLFPATFTSCFPEAERGEQCVLASFLTPAGSLGCLKIPYLFFISRTSLLRVISSACCDEGLCMLLGDSASTML